MPVRSHGSLRAATAAFAGLMLAGLGCHSSPSDHDSFFIPKTSGPPSSGVVAQGVETTTRVGYAAQPVAPSVQPVAAVPTASPVMLQPVPSVQLMPGKRQVIASTFEPVQRVSAEQVVAGPEMPGGAPAVVVNTPMMPARLPTGSAMPTANGPMLEHSDGPVPENGELPAPRPLGPSGNAFMMSAGPMMPHGAMMPPGPPHPSVPREFEKMALPPYVVEPPDILLIQASDQVTLRLQPIRGQHLVGPDGTVNLGIYGRIRVAGLTLDQVADAVAARLLEVEPGLLRGLREVDEKGKEIDKTDLLEDWNKSFRREGVDPLVAIKREMQVDVLVYSSKFYYVITDGGGYGQQVYPVPIRGNETVLDALAMVNGLPAVADKRKVWVARATRAGQPPKILPVDWLAVAKCGQSATNYQLFPGDRVYVDSCSLIKADSFLSKLYSPILRTFGVTLLGASTVNTIKNGTSSGLGAAGAIR